MAALTTKTRSGLGVVELIKLLVGKGNGRLKSLPLRLAAKPPEASPNNPDLNLGQIGANCAGCYFVYAHFFSSAALATRGLGTLAVG